MINKLSVLYGSITLIYLYNLIKDSRGEKAMQIHKLMDCLSIIYVEHNIVVQK